MGCTATRGALRPLELGVALRELGTDLLTEGSSDEGKRDESRFREHFEEDGVGISEIDHC